MATEIKNKILSSEVPIQPKGSTFIKRESVDKTDKKKKTCC